MMSPQSDDDVGQAKLKDDGRQTEHQRGLLGNGGEGGREEDPPPPGIAKAASPTRGGSSQG